MIHELQVQFTKIDKNGNDKVVKEKYLVGVALNFGDAETQGYEHCDGETDLDVVSVKRSKIKEIINKRSNDKENIYVSDVADVRTNDDGEEVEITYKVALFADNMDDAYLKVKEWIKQGYDMVMLGVKKVKYKDVI